eukprot:gene2883-19768_t
MGLPVRLALACAEVCEYFGAAALLATFGGTGDAASVPMWMLTRMRPEGLCTVEEVRSRGLDELEMSEDKASAM